MAASFFDVDGTLVTTNLVHPTVFYLLNQQTPLHSLARIGKTLLRAPMLSNNAGQSCITMRLGQLIGRCGSRCRP